MNWKLLCSFFPTPVSVKSSIVTSFLSAICLIALSSIIVELSWLFSCNTGINQTVTGFCFLSLGFGFIEHIATPFFAGQNSPEADPALTGPYSSLLTLSLGLGLSWTLGSLIQWVKEDRWGRISHGREFSGLALITSLAIAVTLLVMIGVR